MADITTRAGKGSPLTNNEVDANFTNLNTDKAENGANTDITSLAGITGGVSTADYVDFDTLASGVARATGRLTWNDTDGCLEVGLKGSDVTQQIGQEMVTRVYNADSTTIANGEVVYFWSTAGEVIAGKKYIANATIDPHLIVGLATEDIAAGSYGYVTEFGFVRGLDTAAFNPGDILFCSPTVAGAIQSNEPSTPNDVVRIGICLESDSTNGIVLVNPHDVPRADEIRYDNADSGLSSTNVKSAIDELELVKADIALLTSNVTFYLTSANDGVLAGYKQLVTSTLDTNYDEIAFDYLTSTISNTATMLQAWVSDVNVLVGDIAGIVVPIVGNVRKDTGSGDARFYFEVYIRESDGTETLVTTSNVSDYITSTIYGQISLSATVSLQTFTDTDRVVIKLYGQTDSSTAAYELQLGGSSPFRSLFPVPVSVVPSVANAYAIVADTTNFNGKLNSTDNNVQAALETLDDHVHQASEITGLTASNTTTNTSVFNGHLSATDTDIQKALNTLDDVDLQGITDVGATTTTAVTINASLDVDDLKLDGDTISNDGAAVDGNIVLSPKGAGEVDISKVDIDGGAIDGTTIGGTTPGAGTFTDLTVNTTATFAGATIADLGTVTTADINGGTIDGVALDATIADIDNIRIDGNSIISTDGNGNIDLTPNGLGEVNISKVDIAAGEIDGTTIGATVAAAGNFTALDVSTSASFAGATIDDLGTVTTADINGGTIDGADITVGTGKTLSVINGTLTLADDQISGNKIHGGIISNVQIQGTSATFSDDLAVDTDTLFVDVSTDRVGVNIIPNRSFEINSGDTVGQRWSNTSANNFVEMGTTAGSIRFGTQSGDFLLLTGGDSAYAGESTALIVDSDGNVGIGTDDPVYFQSGPVLNIGSTSDTYTQLNLTSSSSGICYLAFGDSTTGTGRYQGLQWFDHSLNTMNWSTDGQSATPRMTINSSGSVGIGIDAPTEKLTVRGDVTLTPDSTSAADRLAVLTIGKRDSGTTGYMGKIDFVGSGTNGFATDIVFSSKTSDFYNSTTIEHMRITASGFVGLGTDDPTAPLSIRKGDSSTTIGGSGSVIKVRNTSGVLNSTSGLELFHGNSETAVQRLCGIYGQYKTYDASGLGGDLVFATQTAGASSVTERMRIDEDGNVGIGNDSPAYQLQIGDGTDTFETIAITSADVGGRSQIFMGDSNVDSMRITYWNDYNELTFGHDANVELKLDSGGNVDITNSLGVGQNAGALRFMATGQSGYTVIGRLTSVSTASYLDFKDSGTTGDYKVRIGSESDDMHLYAGGLPRIIVKDDGDVGIGTTDPDSKLDVRGIILGGASTPSHGQIAFGVQYGGSDNIANTYGTMKSSAATCIGWGVYGSPSTAEGFVSSVDTSLNFRRGALLVDQDELRFLNAAQQTVARDAAVTMTERFKVNANGYVGIGNTNPTRSLDIGDGTQGANAEINSTSVPNFLFSRGGTEVGYIGTTLWNTGSGSDTEFSIRGKTAIGFTIGASEKMRIDSSGDLLVGGTTSSTSRIKITGDGGTYTNYSMLLEGGSEDNAYHSISLMTTGNALGGIIGSNYELNVTTVSQSNTARSSGYIAFGNTTVAGKTSNIEFGGVVKGTAVNVPRMTLDNDGNLLVGKTTVSYTSGTGYLFAPEGSATNSPRTGIVGASASGSIVATSIYSTGASAYRFYVSYGGQIYATSTSIAAISDASLKENVRDLDKGLDTIKALKPRRFDWNNGDGNDIMGFVAQEVEEVMPELVHDYEYDEGVTKKALKMGDMIPSLVKAIQEQQAMIETLQAEVAALKGAN